MVLPLSPGLWRLVPPLSNTIAVCGGLCQRKSDKSPEVFCAISIFCEKGDCFPLCPYAIMAVTTGVRREWISMLYLSIVLLCGAGLFLALLEDRYRFWTTPGRHRGGVRPVPGAVRAPAGAHPRPRGGGPGRLRRGLPAVLRVQPVPLQKQPSAKVFRGLADPVRLRLFRGFRPPVSGGCCPSPPPGDWAGLCPSSSPCCSPCSWGCACTGPSTTTATGASLGSWRACAFCCWRPTWCAWVSWTSSSAPRSPRAGCCWRPCSTGG